MSVRFVRKGQKLGHHIMGHANPAAVFGGAPPLTGAMLLAGYVEADQVTVSGLSDKGAGAPATSFTINKTNTADLNEWGYLVCTDINKDIAWVRMFEGVNGITAARNRTFVSGLTYRPGDTHAYFTWFTQAEDVQVRDENDVVIETWNRPTNSGPGVYYAIFGGVTAVNIETGAFAWTTILDWDSPISSSTLFDLRPVQVEWGGPDNNDLVVLTRMLTQVTSFTPVPIPKPVFGTTVQATYPNIDYARVTRSAVSGTWLVKVNPADGDAASAAATTQVANFNDDIASAGTPFRGFVATERFNQTNFLWNPVTSLWYLSANHSGYASLNVFGTIVGNTKAGQINTRGTDNFGGNNSVKAYICTYDADFEPQNVVTLAPTTLNDGNNRYAYNHSVELVPDGSGDILWGWQNMQSSPAFDLQREGVLGNYGAPYVPTDQSANNSVIVRLDNDLEVVWEASAFASGFNSLGRGHGIRMVPFPDEPTQMLVMISTQNVNVSTSNSVTIFGLGPFTFSSMQTYTVAINIATGAGVDERELAPQSNFDKNVAIQPHQAISGPDVGITYAAALMHNTTSYTNTGLFDTSGVRQYNPGDFWNSNGAVYGTGTSDAVHILAFGADGEPDPTLCWPLMAVAQGSTVANSWAIRAIPL